MKLTTSILAVALTMTTGAVWGQNPDAIDNARSIAKSLQQKQANDTGAALDAAGTPAPAPAKPTAAAPQAAAPQAAAPQTSKPGPGSGAKGPAAMSPAAASNPTPATAQKKPQTAKVAKKPAKAHPVIEAKEPVHAKGADPFTPKTGVSSKAAEGNNEVAAKPKPEEKKWAMTGKRDPFFSPVVQQAAGSGCSTGKKCLEIGQINLRGVVKSDSGFIAVVTNSANKAYFLHESDPVFNGYVVRITGDSVVFQETVQDKLGKPLTREVVKRLFTPAV